MLLAKGDYSQVFEVFSIFCMGLQLYKTSYLLDVTLKIRERACKFSKSPSLFLDEQSCSQNEG